MGSGENSPAMVTPHQNIIKALHKDSYRINLDTPYGFQENADELTTRISGYFEKNVGFPIRDIQIRDLQSSNVSEIEKADWLFSGPGSPTYALRIWSDLDLRPHFDALLQRGSIVMASAAAMSLGSYVMPVYEIYKVGAEPHWLPGLDVLGRATGINATVIAHFNNSQGGTHDTRFCFVGEKRMNLLEELLPESTSILGIDEHTAIAFDLDSHEASIFGKGAVTFQNKRETRVFLSKEKFDYRQLVG
jgi:cyanophycinase-like exopeptidase